MNYSVKQLAKIANITARTLHYYDKKGLLRPSLRRENGYRLYTEIELLKLQQILFLKELDFSLEEIEKIISSPKFNSFQALSEQRKLLLIKKDRLDKILKTIEKTIKYLKGGDKMKNDDLFAAFSDNQMEEYKEEAKKRWGHTKAYKQSVERTKNWTKQDYQRIKEEGEAFTKELAKAMDKDMKSPQVQALIAQHHQGIETFYDCSYEIYRGLGKLYIEDPRFRSFYDKYRPGLAEWLQKAIEYYCDTHQQKQFVG